MMRITIARDRGHTDMPETVALTKLVRRAKQCSLAEAQPVVEAGTRGETIVLEVSSMDELQGLAKRVVEAGFIVHVDIADDVVLGVAWKRP